MILRVRRKLFEITMFPNISFVGSLVGEELDEIHHVIELVLLGLDP